VAVIVKETASPEPRKAFSGSDFKQILIGCPLSFPVRPALEEVDT
jgi:hypothetical protein